MRICFVGPANSAHIVKWCDWFAKRGHEVHVISFTQGEIPSAKIHLIDIGVNPQKDKLAKIKYLFTGKEIKGILKQIEPDIVNAHYATSYGVAIALAGVNNYILSVWGSDIYDFPKKSPFHKALLKYSLKKAKYLFSTSQAMADEASKYTDKKFEITPFGVDMDLFNPNKRTRNKGEKDDFIVGTVKGLSEKNGISYLLKAVAQIRHDTDIPIKVRIAGKGNQEEEYHQLADDLGISDITTWLGFISQEKAAVEWANMDIAIIPSTLDSESFGVSAVEAQACGTAVIISDIPGLMEATKPNFTSLVVKRKDEDEIAKAIIKLYSNNKLRENFAMNARCFAMDNYELNNCFINIENLYKGYKDRV